MEREQREKWEVRKKEEKVERRRKWRRIKGSGLHGVEQTKIGWQMPLSLTDAH